MKTETQDRRLRKIYPGFLFGLLGIAMLLLAACQPTAVPNTGGNPTQSQPTAMPNTGGNPTQSQPTAMPNTGGNPTQSQPGSQSVNLVNTSFDPQQMTVKAGTTVIWTNKDSMAHTVTADDKSFDSGNLNPGDTFKFTFTKAGTFHYYCKYHGGPNGQGMSGTIVVTGE